MCTGLALIGCLVGEVVLNGRIPMFGTPLLALHGLCMDRGRQEPEHQEKQECFECRARTRGLQGSFG